MSGLTKEQQQIMDILADIKQLVESQLAALRLAREAMSAAVHEQMYIPASGMTARATLANMERMRVAIAAIDEIVPADEAAQ